MKPVGFIDLRGTIGTCVRHTDLYTGTVRANEAAAQAILDTHTVALSILGIVDISSATRLGLGLGLSMPSTNY